MNSRLKRRLVVITGVAVVVVIIVAAVVAGQLNPSVLSVPEAASGKYNGSKVEVSGVVVDNSHKYQDGILTFAIYEDGGDKSKQLNVVYDKGVTSNFGNESVATCTGTIDDEGVLRCSSLVTTCPTKYESSVDALEVSRLLNYGYDTIVNKPVKIIGIIQAGSLNPAGQDVRFIIKDQYEQGELNVVFNDAISDEIGEGSVVVLTGRLTATDTFEATVVALPQEN